MIKKCSSLISLNGVFDCFCCSVEWLILDEADKLFEEGKDGFREQVRYLYLAVLFTQENCLSHFGKKSVLEPSLVQFTNECFFPNTDSHHLSSLWQTRSEKSIVQCNHVQWYWWMGTDSPGQCCSSYNWHQVLYFSLSPLNNLRTLLESSVIQDPHNSSPEICFFTKIPKMSF